VSVIDLPSQGTRRQSRAFKSCFDAYRFPKTEATFGRYALMFMKNARGARENSRRLQRRSGRPEHRARNSYRDREKARKARHGVAFSGWRDRNKARISRREAAFTTYIVKLKR
jgi:hypothetical protein